jgi:hypothetical protein
MESAPISGKLQWPVPGLSTCFEVRSIVTASARCADTRPPRGPPWECVAAVAQGHRGFPSLPGCVKADEGWWVDSRAVVQDARSAEI